MNKKTGKEDSQKTERFIKEAKRKTRTRFSSQGKIRIIMMGMRVEARVSGICRQFGIVESLSYKWTKDFMEAGKKRLMGDTARQANTSEVKRLRQQLERYKLMVAETAHGNRILETVQEHEAR